MAVIHEQEDREIRNLRHRLLEAGVISKSEIRVNHDLIEEAYRISITPQGLAMQLYNQRPQLGTNIVKYEAATNPSTGQNITKPLHDAVEIFRLLKQSRDTAVEDERKRQQEVYDKAEMDWYYYDKNTPQTFEARWDSKTGKVIDKEYFMQNLHRCPHPTCSYRANNQDDVAKHARYLHGILLLERR